MYFDVVVQDGIRQKAPILQWPGAADPPPRDRPRILISFYFIYLRHTTWRHEANTRHDIQQVKSKSHLEDKSKFFRQALNDVMLGLERIEAGTER